jgi:choline dehydrogenase-like flavoprotein
MRTTSRPRAQTIERYGLTALPQGSTLADWPLTCAELEPYYDRIEHDLGVAGKAGNLQGRKIDGGSAPRCPTLSLQRIVHRKYNPGLPGADGDAAAVRRKRDIRGVWQRNALPWLKGLGVADRGVSVSN